MARKLNKESATKLSSESAVSTGRTTKHRTSRTKTASVVVQPPAPAAPAHEEIAKLAYSFWLERGCQGGSPEEDWTRAERELLAQI